MARKIRPLTIICLSMLAWLLWNQGTPTASSQGETTPISPETEVPEYGIQQLPVITAILPLRTRCPLDRPMLLLDEDFDDREAQGWEIAPTGSWYISGDDVQNDYYLSARAFGAFSFRGLPLKGTYSISFTLSAFGGNLDFLFGLRPRYSNYTASFQAQNKSEMFLTLHKRDALEGDNTWGTYGPDARLAYKARIDVDQGRIRFYLWDADGKPINDGQPVIDYTDPSPLPPGDLSFTMTPFDPDGFYFATVDDILVCTVNPLPDLTVPWVSAYYDPAADELLIEAEILNKGDSESKAFEALAVSAENMNEPSQRLPVSPLAPGKSIILSYRIRPSFEQYGQTLTYQILADPDDQIQELDQANNSTYAKPVTLPFPADLVPVIDQAWYNQPARNVILSGYVINNGGLASAPCEIWIGSDSAGFSGTLVQIPELAPGSTAPVSLILPASEDQAGNTVIFSVQADASDAVRELDENNNLIYTAPIEITRDESQPIPQPDLIIRPLSVFFDPDARVLGIEALVRNIGSKEAEAGTARIESKHGLFDDRSFPQLGQEEEYVLTFAITVPPEIGGEVIDFTPWVDIENTSQEINEENNTAQPVGFLIPLMVVDVPTLTDQPVQEPTEIIVEPTVPELPPPGDTRIPGGSPSLGTILLIGVGLLFGGWLLFRALRFRPVPPRSSGGDQGGGSDNPSEPVPPFIPPIQLLHLWVTEGGENGRILGPTMALTTGGTYTLHARLAQVFQGSRSQASAYTPMEVVTFALPEEVEIRSESAPLSVPNLGDSQVVTQAFRPKQSGICRIRACVYYQNILVQSAVLEAEVTDSPLLRQAGFGIRQLLDYVATANLETLSGLRPRALNIFINDSGSDTHWIGFHAGGELAGVPLVLSKDTLKHCAKNLRKALYKIELDTNFWSDKNLPVDSSTHRLLPSEMAEDARMLMDLAEAGVRAFDSLFASSGQEPSVLQQLEEALSRPGIISIARLSPDVPTMPWAALYRHEIRPALKRSWQLCPTFQEQMLANRWENPSHLAFKADEFDRPAACTAKGGCALRAAPVGGKTASQDMRRLTVCPFGFLGYTHQIEQPDQYIHPVPADGQTIPGELRWKDYGQKAAISKEANQPLRVAVGLYQGFPDAHVHYEEIRQLCAGASVQEITDLNTMLDVLEDGDQHILYFYCHGRSAGEGTQDDEPGDGYFRLEIGPENGENYISASDLPRPNRTHWKVPGLVFLNGCNTAVDLLPDTLNDYVVKLRRLGASGVVGCEISVHTALARPFGRRVIKSLMCGSTLGESFLEARLDLLRQGSPLGLAYAYYASADLHLHLDSNCPRCSPREKKP